VADFLPMQLTGRTRICKRLRSGNLHQMLMRQMSKRNMKYMSPFDADQIAFLESSYDVKLDWLLVVQHSRGSVFHDAGDRTSHMPVIFIDNRDSILYFVQTD
jgi:hypothetical protein